MEIPVQPVVDQNKNCSQCLKKQSLIEKYQSLITLLKKKADRSHLSQLSQSNKFSMGDVTTSHTSFNGPSAINKYLLALVLSKIQPRRLNFAFSQIKSQSYIQKSKKGQSFFNKLHKICLIKQKQGFKKLNHHQINCKDENLLCSQTLIDNKFTLEEGLKYNTTFIKQKQRSQQQSNSPSNQKSLYSQLQNSITVQQHNYKSLAYMHQDLITSINKSDPLTLKEQSLPFFVRKKQSPSTQKVKNLYKNLFVLQQQNYAYQIKIKDLQRHMQEALSRQIKQNRKKTESLEMVAQEMTQKNQLISELQQKIAILEQKYEIETNGVLEDQLTQQRKQVQKLQKVNLKLDNQLRKIKEKLAQSSTALQTLQKENSMLSQVNYQLKQALFLIDQKILSLEQKQIRFQSSCKRVEKIFQKLKFQERSISRHSKGNNSKIQYLPYRQQKKSLQEFYRLEMAFVFLYNIEDQAYNFSQFQHLFDDDQLQVLKELKEKLQSMRHKLEGKFDLMQTIQCAQYGIKETNINKFQQHIEGRDQSQNVYCHQNMGDGSIFDVLNDHRYNNSRIEEIPNSPQRIEPQKNLTMKLLQLQIEKNKQIQKISELKQKSMYVRNIILNLMKSLELKQSTLKIETVGILDLIFDVFQYSEEEKKIMFTHVQQTKEKKFFGFI